MVDIVHKAVGVTPVRFDDVAASLSLVPSVELCEPFRMWHDDMTCHLLFSTLVIVVVHLVVDALFALSEGFPPVTVDLDLEKDVADILVVVADLQVVDLHVEVDESHAVDGLQVVDVP